MEVGPLPPKFGNGARHGGGDIVPIGEHADFIIGLEQIAHHKPLMMAITLAQKMTSATAMIAKVIARSHAGTGGSGCGAWGHPSR